MEEEMNITCRHGQPRECELEDETNEYNSMSQVWVKEEVLVKQEVTNDLEPEIEGKRTSYMEKNYASSFGQYKEDEIAEKHEPIPQVWVKEEIKQEPLDPSLATDKLKLQSEYMPNSSDECKRENENVENGDEWINEETEIQDVKSVCETFHEQEFSASNIQLPLETVEMKHCCRQNMLLGKDCDICRKTAVIQKKLYKCQICNTEFTKKSEIHSHLSIHADNYKCDICLKIFVHQRTLKKHKLLLHGDEGKHLCPTCIKQFKTNSELQAHLISHHNKRIYPCSICKKLFMRQRSLTMHLRTHSADNRFKCEVCLKRFSRYLRFVEHERLHTGEKPFKCSVCGKEFMRRNSMICHQRLHSGEKLHACNMCEKKFSRRYHLVRHLRGHPQSGLNKSTVSICGDKDPAGQEGGSLACEGPMNVS